LLNLVKDSECDWRLIH